MMKLSEYASYDGLSLAKLVENREVTAKELGELMLAAVEQVNPQVNAVIETYSERVAGMSQDDKLNGVFGGVPFLIKDFGLMEAGKKSECGSRLAEGWVAPVDAHLTRKFQQAGLTLLGRTATPEFALSGSTETVLNGATRNPWDLLKMAGGSSGGAGASIAAGIVPMAHGSDGAGSIRIPASCCNLVGLKTSRGRVSAAPNGEHAYSFGVDFILSRSVRDTAAMLDAVGGPAPGDFVTIQQPTRPYLDEVTAKHQPLKIAFTTKTWGPAGTDPEVAAITETVAKQCEALGHTVVEASPSYDYEPFLEAMLVMWAFGVDSWFDRLAQEMGRMVNEETLEAVTHSYYRYARSLTPKHFVDAMGVLNQVNRDTGRFFEQYDLLLTPTLGLLPQDIGRYSQNLDMSFYDFFRRCDESMAFLPLFNMSGQPAISIPAGMSRSGLPVGVQFAGRFGDESTLIGIAGQLEQAMPWNERWPEVHVG